MLYAFNLFEPFITGVGELQWIVVNALRLILTWSFHEVLLNEDLSSLQMGRWEGASCRWILPSWSEESDTSLVPEHGKKGSSTGQNQVTVCSYMLHLLIRQEWTENLYFLDLIFLVPDYKKLGIRCVLPGGLTKGGEKFASSLSRAEGMVLWVWEQGTRGG